VARRRLGDLLSCDGDTMLAGQHADPNPMFGGNTGAAPVTYACMINPERSSDIAVGPDLFEQGPVREAGLHRRTLTCARRKGQGRLAPGAKECGTHNCIAFNATFWQKTSVLSRGANLVKRGRNGDDKLTASAIMQDFGHRLRWLREACEELEPGMHSQEQWAEAYSVNAATMSRWENGFVGNNFDALVSIALSTGVDMNYLFLGVVPEWTPEPLRDLLYLRHPALTTPAQFGAALATQRQAGSLRAQRPVRQRRRRFRKPKS
jgi:Helix-turn-helix domain